MKGKNKEKRNLQNIYKKKRNKEKNSEKIKKKKNK